MKKRIYLSPPNMGGEEKKYIDSAFASNWIAPIGTNIDLFEEKVANYLGGNFKVTALNSGTSAIHLGLKLLNVQKQDEVLVQSHTHVASVNPVLYLGATPVFIDSESETGNICPDFLEEAIKDRIKKGKKPKAIITVDLYGMPYKANEIKKLSKYYGIPVLEDAAEALGSFYNDQPCGTLGDIGVISFNGNKILTTSAGGVLITNKLEQKEKALYWANQSKEDLPYYEHKEEGYNYRMSNICAGIGCGQMEVLEERIKQKQAVNQFYQSIFKNHSELILQQPINKNFKSNFWVSNIFFKKDAKTNPEQLRLHLESFNIESRRFWKPMHLQPLFNNFPYYGNQVSENLFNKGLCLPSGSNQNLADQEVIKLAIDRFFNLKL